MKKLKFSSINKRHLTLIGLVAVVAVAGYANINYTEKSVETMATVEESSTTEISEDEYTIAIMERDNKRSESMQVYRDIIENSNCDNETKKNAQTMLTASANYINDENTIQNSLKAKGIEKSVVYIDDNEVTVIVYEKKLDNVSVSQIKDIVHGTTGIIAENIKIIEN